MRSRFAAFALEKVGYIMQTEQLDTPSSREELIHFCEQMDFVGLQILAETELTVTFHAVLLQNGRDASFTERSLFEKQGGRWLYVGALLLDQNK